jgi:hypothetical protein
VHSIPIKLRPIVLTVGGIDVVDSRLGNITILCCRGFRVTIWVNEEPDPYALLMVASSPGLGSFVARNRDITAVSCAIFEEVSSPSFPIDDLFLNKTIDA